MMPGGKFAALVFLAPAKGHYVVMGNVRAGVWQGDGSVVSLSVLTYDPVTKKITRLNSVATPKDTDVKLSDLAVDLDAGQELILAPLVGAMYTAANVELTSLQIQASGPSTPPKAGDVLTVNGQQYKVIKSIANTLTLQASP